MRWTQSLMALYLLLVFTSITHAGIIGKVDYNEEVLIPEEHWPTDNEHQEVVTTFGRFSYFTNLFSSWMSEKDSGKKQKLFTQTGEEPYKSYRYGRENRMEGHSAQSHLIGLTESNWGVSAVREGQCEEYLKKYGYLSYKNMTDNLLARKQKALQEFQRKYKLTVTGICDTDTLIWMSLPRCGMSDVPKVTKTFRTKRYIISGKKWEQLNLAYCIDSFDDTLGETQSTIILKKALKHWEDASQISFTQDCSDPDMKLSFFRGEHNTNAEDSNFDGLGNVLAHAFSPPLGEIHFDLDENWTFDNTQGMNLEQVATHEVGHALGLNHSTVAESVMSSIYTGYDPNFRLHHDDIAGIQSLYGPPDKPEGLYDGFGGSVLFSNIAKGIELRTTLDPGCPAFNSEVQSTMCNAIQELVGNGGIEISNCRIGQVTNGIVSHIKLDILPPEGEEVSLILLAELVNRATLSPLFTLCDILSTEFISTPDECPAQYGNECRGRTAECLPLTSGYTCSCRPGFINVQSRADVICSITGVSTPAPGPSTTTESSDSFDSGLGSDFVVGLSVGGAVVVLVAIILLVVAIYCKRTRSSGQPFFANSYQGNVYGGRPRYPAQGYPPRSFGPYQTDVSPIPGTLSP